MCCGYGARLHSCQKSFWPPLSEFSGSVAEVKPASGIKKKVKKVHVMTMLGTFLRSVHPSCLLVLGQRQSHLAKSQTYISTLYL